MSCFLGLFRCLLGWEEDENTTHRLSYGYHLDSQSRLLPPQTLSSHSVPTRDKFSWTTPTYSSPRLGSQSNAHIITTRIQPQSHSSHFKLRQTTTPSSTRATLASDNRSLCEAPKTTVPESKIVTKDISIGSEIYKSKPEKISGAFLKPKMLSPSTLKPDSSRLGSQSNAQIITNRIQPQSHSSHFKLRQTTTPSSTRATLASDNRSLCEAPKTTVPESKIVTKDMSIGSEIYKSKPEKISGAFLKPKMLSPSTLKPDSSCLGSQSNAQIITNRIQPQSHSSHFKLRQTTTPSSTRATLASDNRSLCEAPKTTVPESKIVTKDISIGSEIYKSKPEKISEAFLKPKMLSPSTLKPDSSSSSSGKLLPSPKPPLNLTMHLKKANHIRIETGTSSTFIIPDNIEDLIKKSLMSGPPPSKLKPDSTSSSSPKPHLYFGKPILSQAPVNLTMDQMKTNYVRVEKGTSPIYKVPENVENLIKKDILPKVLKKPLSPSTYKDFFHTMLYAEDCYLDKWDGFEMENVTLKVEDAAIYRRKGTYKNLNKTILEEEDGKVFVAFEIDSVPQNRPFLLSRDFASVRPSGRRVEPFKGIIYRVVKSNKVLVEFGEDFHDQHYQEYKYDVKFSFNRICLKRAHQAIETASDRLLKNFLFPSSDCLSKIVQFPTLRLGADDKLDRKQSSAVQQIYSHHAPPAYLVVGPLCLIGRDRLSRTGVVIREAVLQIYRTKPKARILLCAPTNNASDVLMGSLQKEIPESNMFRANAAFREVDEVLSDILPSCRMKGDCFSCPSLKELKKFKVISSTYMSCFRLHNEGLVAGHFSQIFMLDASSVIEPEALVALANFADESTDVVVAGATGNHSHWVRSNMARRNGLLRSYFERLCESELYGSLDPKLISQL